MVEPTFKPNGLKPQSWGDILAIATLLAMFIGVLAWGLKLEGELNVVRDRQIEILQSINAGILPRADERIEAIHERLDAIEGNLQILVTRSHEH